MVIIQIRTADLQSGDVINRRGPERQGWMEVDHLEVLAEGDLVVHDEHERDSFTATGYDLVWLQTLRELTGNSHLPTPVERSQLA